MLDAGKLNQPIVLTAFDEVVLCGDQFLVSLTEKLTPDREARLNAIVRDLIPIFDRPFGSDELKWRAAHLVAGLAAKSATALEQVITNAKLYASVQHIDDAFPWAPNGFTVLGEIGSENERVASFLHQVVKTDYGVAKAAAEEALSTACPGRCSVAA